MSGLFIGIRRTYKIQGFFLRHFIFAYEHTGTIIIIWGGLGRLATWHLPGGPVGPPARWAATPNIEGGNETEEGAQRLLARKRGLYLDILLAVVPEFLVTPLLMRPVYLISRGRFEEPVRP